MHSTSNAETSAAPNHFAADVLHDVYVLRRRVSVGVSGIVALYVPLYFLFGFTLIEVAGLTAIAIAITAVTVNLVFRQIVALRKRSAYPEAIAQVVAEVDDSSVAAARSLEVVQSLLSPQAAFLSLIGPSGAHVVVARHAVTADAAVERLNRYGNDVTAALSNAYPRDISGGGEDVRIVLVPLLAMKKHVGILYLADRRSNRDLADRLLLATIGSAIGMALDSLVQKEQILQKESRLRSLTTGAPVILFAIDNDGLMTFIQGKGIERLGVSPENIIGRPTTDVFANYPQVLQGFRRAFAGEEVTAVVTLSVQDLRVIYEYRVRPERDDRGRVVGIIGVATDITDRRQAEDALHESQRALETLVGNLPGFAYRCLNDEHGVMEYVSAGIEDVVGYSADEIAGEQPMFGDLIHVDDRAAVRDAVARALEAREHFQLEYRIRTAYGQERWVWEQGQAIYSDDGEVVALEGFVSEITERKRAEQALAASEARYRDLFENANDIIFTHDLHGKFGSLNHKAEEIGGYTRRELLGRTVWDVIAPEYQEIAVDNAGRILAGEEPSPFELDIIAKDGSRIPVEVSERVLRDEDGQPVLIQGIARDISDRRHAEETIRRLAYYDSLTGLPNRALFEDRLALALTQARRQGAPGLAVMFLDLDDFKLVNDTLGHNAGDRLLEGVARELLALVRDGDTVARVGGDEFTLLLPGIDGPEYITDVAERILECLRQPRVIGGQEFITTGSIGVTTYPNDGGEAETLLRNADTAMYRAKERGRNNFQLYSPAMNERMLERLSFEKDLRHAMSGGELVVYYQPIVNVATGEVAGVEALLRWPHPTRGIIQPDDFIPMAEESGLIIEMGEAVLRDACNQLLSWEGDGLVLQRVAVNLSARQLQQEDLVNRITKILLETGVAPHRVQLEITEGAVLKNVDQIIATLNQLRAMGISIALDDFGTGYSSLSYLKRFPIHAVKIDRSFVRDLEHDASDATIVSTVIAMAENMGLTVIAEGVETEKQLAFLRERGCDEFQGNLVSQPVRPDQVRELLQQGTGAVRPAAVVRLGSRRRAKGA